ncbi:MAG: hypothetical protein HQL32_01830 [Planctomycetes bacterium]|nr:hypothetical protein [Planctomycetota bacterium]
MLEVEFYGVRGPQPLALSRKVMKERLLKTLENYQGEDLNTEENRLSFIEASLEEAPFTGGHSNCVRLHGHEEAIILFGAGSGLKACGQKLLEERNSPKEIYLFLSHTHWDYISGLPYFEPLFHEEYSVNIMSCSERLKEQCELFLNGFSHLQKGSIKATLYYQVLQTAKMKNLGQVKVTPYSMNEEGSNVAFLASDTQKSVVYSTDTNYQYIYNNSEDNSWLNGVDMWVYDAMYNFDDYLECLDEAHSTSLVGVDMALQNQVKHLVLYHFEHDYNEKELECLRSHTQAYAESHNGHSKDMKISLAYEGMRLNA